MRRRPTGGFSSLESAADGVLRRMSTGDSALLWIQARWPRIVGEPLARRATPVALTGRRLVLSVDDPAWRKPVASALPELERKLAMELPGVRPRVIIRERTRGH